MKAEIARHIREGDEESRRYRERRMEQLLEIIPGKGFMQFGGSEGGLLYDEVRLAFVNGLFYCTILSAIELVERHVLGKLRISGFDVTAETDFEKVLESARQQGFWDDVADKQLGEYRRLRDAYSPMRKPSYAKDSSGEMPNTFVDLVVQDAAAALSMLPPILGC